MSNNIPTGTIIFDVVSKRYRLGTLGTLRNTVESLLQNRQHNDNKRDLWALKDVSFRVEPGGSLGLIGPNGAGKTTVLKLLSNITRPTSGRIIMQGRASSLIELGAGFHPELTGRENIYLNGAILGLKQRDLARKFDDIVAFSELERYLDTPVKRYSSGMYVRLAFAVAAHIEPDILLVDEVLAVGDGRFRRRCIERIRNLQRNGTTIILVSHSMYQINQICNSAILLVNGQISEQGIPAYVVERYNELMLENLTEEASSSAKPDHVSVTSDDLILTSVTVFPSPSTNTYLAPHTAAKVSIAYHAPNPVQIGRVHVAIYESDHTLCCVADSAAANPEFSPGELSGTGLIEIIHDPLLLTPGDYYVVVQVTDAVDAGVIASCASPFFKVVTLVPGDHSGVFVPNASWRMSAQPT